MNHLARHRLPPSLAALCLCLCGMATAAPPPNRELDKRTDLPRPDVPVSSVRCARPFENRGTFVIPAGFSGAGASSRFIPADRFLELRRLKATLREPGLRAGNLALNAAGVDEWYDLRVENGAALYSAAKDGALYADRGTRIKFVAYRGNDHARAVTGDYLISGCLVDARPPITTVPDIRAPRLPKKRLTPPEPVEVRTPVQR